MSTRAWPCTPATPISRCWARPIPRSRLSPRWICPKPWRCDRPAGPGGAACRRAAEPAKTVMLCWNASRESARAASDALPLLRAAAKVIVLCVDPRSSAHGHGAEPGADAAAWLSRHGVKVTVQRDVAANSDVGNVILSRAADLDVGLIVMGLYGHSRLRETVLGGASRTLLASMTVPLFVSH